MQLPAPQWGHRVLDGLAYQVVAEGLEASIVDEQPGMKALVEGAGFAVGHRLHQHRLGMTAEDGGGVEGVPGGAGEWRGSCEHDISHRDGKRSRFGSERLDEEEGIAAGGGVEPGGVEEPVADQGPHGVDGQRWDLDPGDVRLPTRAPMARRMGWSWGTSSRWVARTRQGSESRRRATKRRRSRVASSAALQVFEHEHGGGRRRPELREDGVEHLCLIAASERVGQRTGVDLVRCRPVARGGAGRRGRRIGPAAPVRR